MLKSLKSLIVGFYSLLVGMKVTITNFFRHSVTLQYPWERYTPPERYRGLLKMKGFFSEEEIDRKSQFYPGTQWAPCIKKCPARVDVRGYVTLVEEGRYKEALELLKNTYPLPGVLGRVCPAPCEKACTRGKVIGDPVGIRKLKRFIADYELQLPPEERFSYRQQKLPANGKKIAIIGAGPAGLMAATNLALWGFKVTIFEKLPLPGGYLAIGIPDYRLPKDVLEREIKAILDIGVELKLNTEIGNNISWEELRNMKFDAIFIGAGATAPMKLKIPNEDCSGVISGEHFLQQVNLRKKVNIGKKVVVVGGGNTAIDAARTALRLGAKVIILYRRTIEEMPAAKEEIEDAIEEGVEIKFLVAPVKVIPENGKVKKLEIIRNKLGEPDQSGRRRPVAIPGSEYTIEVDTIIPAISRSPALTWLPSEIKKTKWGTIEIDEYGRTSMEGVYAGGDVVTGPATVIEAIAQGKLASHTIAHDLGYPPAEVKNLWPHQKEAIIPGEKIPLTGKDSYPVQGNGRDKLFDRERPYLLKPHQVKMPKLSPNQRKENFQEVELGLSSEQAKEESSRCFSCEVERCIGCGVCVDICPVSAIYLKKDINPRGKSYTSNYSIDLNLCMFCGLCTEVCPTKSLTMTDKYELSIYNRQLNFVTLKK